MMHAMIPLCFTCLLSVGMDANLLPLEEAQRYARVCVQQVGALADAQIIIKADTKKPCATLGEGGGAMVVPDEKLSVKKVQEARELVPVGQLWFRKWTTVIKNKPVPAERLRMVTIHVDDKDRPMALFLVGVRQKGKAGLELVLYAQDNVPHLVLPLEKLMRDQELPVELEWQRGEKNSDSLIVKLVGKYHAVIPITRQGK
jgi:hypothetical protein